jgi:integrase
MAKGATFISVKERLGHASAAFTMNTYLHGTENDQRAAAEAMSEVFAI